MSQNMVNESHHISQENLVMESIDSHQYFNKKESSTLQNSFKMKNQAATLSPKDKKEPF